MRNWEPEMKDNLILLVEDCAEDASLVLVAFKKWGITNPVHVIPDGESALDYLTGNGQYADRDEFPLPCLAILDLNLPQMSGFDLLEWLSSRSEPELSNLPVVVLSGTPDKADLEQASRLGAIACVSKTLDLAALYELIQHMDYFSHTTDMHASGVEWFPES
jgi:CheY-like chemotaxis protein